MKQLRSLLLIIVGLAVLAYLGGITWAGVASLLSTTEPQLPDIVTQAITAIGALLATHFGAIFGISRFTAGSGERTSRLGAWPRLPPRSNEPAPTFEWLQVGAAWVYVASLILAVAFWAFDGFSSSSARALISMSSTLIGVFAGVFAVALNVSKRP